MAEEIKETQEAHSEEATETETDWEAKYKEMRGHAREWEARAKANQSAADELEEMKAAQMTELEKANARAEAAEAESAKLRAEKERTETARKIANESGVPFDLLMFCESPEAMEGFAKQYQTEQPRIHSAAQSKARVLKDEPRTKGDVFADAIAGML